MNTKGMMVSIVTAMMVLAMFASTAMASTITVDGDGSDWNSEWRIDPSPAATLDPYGDAGDAPGDCTIYGYDLKNVWQHYDSGTDTMYWRYDVWWEVPGDLNGDYDPDAPSGIPPGDGYRVGLHEHYTIIINNHTANELCIIYQNNAFTTSTGGVPVGLLYAEEGRAPTPPEDRCIEFSLSNAKTYMDPGDYTIYGLAGGSKDIPGEDYLEAEFRVKSEFEFEFEQACCKRMAFTGTATSNNMINHTWDFGGESLTVDGSPNGKDPVIHQYTDCGWYTVTLSGWYGTGGYITQSSSAPQNVYVNCGPTAKVSVSPTKIDANVPTLVEFDGSASTADGPPIDTYEWSFSDGDKKTGKIVTKTVTLGTDQTLDATLTVNDTHCESSTTVTVGSKRPPIHKPPSDVPILTPIGMVALIGMLCIVGAGRILTKGRRS